MVTTNGSLGPSLSAELLAVGPGDRVFVDTNVFAYEATPTAPFHAAAHTALSHLLAVRAELWLSRQILREFIATLTRPQPYALATPASVVLANARQLEARLRVADDNATVFATLAGILGAVPCGGRQVYDANIVATMNVHGVPNLLTHNVKDFARFSSYVTIIPLVP